MKNIISIVISLGIFAVSANAIAGDLSYEDKRVVERLVKTSIQCNANRRGGSSIRRAEVESSSHNGDFFYVYGNFTAEKFFVSYSGSFQGKFHKSGHLDRLQFKSNYESGWVDVDQDCLP